MLCDGTQLLHGTRQSVPLHPHQAAHGFVDHNYVSAQLSLCEEEDLGFNCIQKLFHSNNNIFCPSLYLSSAVIFFQDEGTRASPSFQDAVKSSICAVTEFCLLFSSLFLS